MAPPQLGRSDTECKRQSQMKGLHLMDNRIKKLEEIMRKELQDSAHDIEHVMRVYAMCLRLSEDEPGLNLDVIKAAALLHDIARVKEDTDDTGETDHAVLGAEMAVKILRDMKFPPDFIESVREAIRSHRLRSDATPESRESQILYDADKIDVLGAVGIARCYMIAGRYGEPIYKKVDLDEYARQNLVGGRPDGRIRELSKHSPNIEFENKLRHIPEKLHSERARSIARDRLKLMTEFFRRLEQEAGLEPHLQSPSNTKEAQ